ncbi:MAG: GGDEF domain-containing phosphodiesterase, partial [Candidatus Omnitrophota bacterium]
RSTISRIERAIRSKNDFAICCIDLSDLGAYNTAYGDVRGDEVIIQFSKIIQQAVKRYGSAEAFVGHLGGDDFIAVTASDTCVAVCEALIKQFDHIGTAFYDHHDREQGYLVQRNKEGSLTQYPLMRVCVTIIQNKVTPITEPSEISRIAQELKNYMKTLPGSCYIKYCRPGISGKGVSAPADGAEPMLEICFPTRGKNVLVPRLYRHGGTGIFLDSLIRQKEIRSVYQPIVDLQTREVVGYEALTRTLGDPCADEASRLFAAAREAGCIKELDVLCVESALISGQKLAPGKKLFINVNHETLLDQARMKRLFDFKGSIGFKNIVIEVTEQSLLRSFDKVREMLIELKEQGVLVAIDDVGGGAVSLRDVATLRPDFIKFDRSLIRQIDQSTTKQQVVLSLILFARGIHAMTSAEGIVSKEEYETCLMCGIDLGQGHYFGKPETAFLTKPLKCQ